MLAALEQLPGPRRPLAKPLRHPTDLRPKVLSDLMTLYADGAARQDTPGGTLRWPAEEAGATRAKVFRISNSQNTRGESGGGIEY